MFANALAISFVILLFAIGYHLKKQSVHKLGLYTSLAAICFLTNRTDDQPTQRKTVKKEREAGGEGA